MGRLPQIVRVGEAQSLPRSIQPLDGRTDENNFSLYDVQVMLVL